MRLTINHTHRGLSPADAHQLYQWLFWDVSISHDYDLSQELAKSDIWYPINRFGTENRARAELNNSPVLQRFCREFDQLKDVFFDMIKNDKFFQWRWTQPADAYLERISMVTAIYKDMPGHVMQPHLDNSHIMMQTVINLRDNPSSTDLYSFIDQSPIYQSTRERDKGVTFLNTPGAVHGITNLEHDRYILYSALMYS